MKNNGFLHNVLTAGAVGVLGAVAAAIAGGPTGGFAAFLAAHPTFEVGFGLAAVPVVNFIHTLIGDLTGASAPANSAGAPPAAK